MTPGAFASLPYLRASPFPSDRPSGAERRSAAIPRSGAMQWQLHRVESTPMITRRVALPALLPIVAILAACTSLSPHSPAEIPTSTSIAMSPPGEQTTALPSPTPPLDAEFQDVTLTPGRLRGDWSVIGLVTNQSSGSVGGVDLEVSLFDANNSLLAVQTVGPALTTLAAGAQSPFAARFSGAGAADHVRVEVIAYHPSGQSSAPVEVEQLETRPTGDGRMAVYGLAVNGGRQTVEIVDLVLMAMSPNGRPMALSEKAAGLSVLDAGASAPFVAVLGASDASVQLQAFSFAQPIASRSSPALSFSGPIRIQVARDGSPLVIGTLHNDSHDWMNADVVVDLRQGDDLVGLGALELPWPLAPGELQPFLMSEFPGLLERTRSLGIEPGNLVATAEIDPAGSRISTSPPITLQADITAQEVIESSLFLKGTLTNGGSEKVDRPSAVAVLRSTQGEVISAGFVVAGTELGAGQSLPFILVLRLPADADLAMAEFDLRAGGFLAE
jgi:hypothetical protein